jgi:hypothetical protein
MATTTHKARDRNVTKLNDLDVHGRSSTEGDKHDSTPGISPHQSQDRVNRLSPGHLGAYLPTCLPICLPAYLSTHVPARLPIFSPHGVNLQTRHHQHQHRHQHQPRGSSPAQPPPPSAGAGKPTGEQRNTNRHGAASSSQCTLSAVLARQEKWCHVFVFLPHSPFV